MSHSPAVELEVGHRTVRITNPERVYFPARGETKIDLARYYLSVGDGTGFAQAREVAAVAQEVLAEVGAVGA